MNNNSTSTQDPLKTQVFGGPKTIKTSSLSDQIFGQTKKTPPFKKPKVEKTYENFGEIFEDVKKDFNKQIKTKDTVKTAWEQLLGKDNIFTAKKESGISFEPGQEIDLAALQEQQEEQQRQAEDKNKIQNIDGGYNYKDELLHGGEKASRKENEETQRQIQELIVEIKRIGAQIKELDKQATEATEGSTQMVGKYHKSFFKSLLSLLEDSRTKMEDGNSWLQATGKKNMKGKIGAPTKNKAKMGDVLKQNIKKGNTKFTQSGERSLATSSG